MARQFSGMAHAISVRHIYTQTLIALRALTFTLPVFVGLSSVISFNIYTIYKHILIFKSYNNLFYVFLFDNYLSYDIRRGSDIRPKGDQLNLNGHTIECLVLRLQSIMNSKIPACSNCGRVQCSVYQER